MKLCINCKHCNLPPEDSDKPHGCVYGLPEEIDIVTGQKYVVGWVPPCRVMRGIAEEEDSSLGREPCGKEGKFYEPANSNESQFMWNVKTAIPSQTTCTKPPAIKRYRVIVGTEGLYEEKYDTGPYVLYQDYCKVLKSIMEGK